MGWKVNMCQHTLYKGGGGGGVEGESSGDVASCGGRGRVSIQHNSGGGGRGRGGVQGLNRGVDTRSATQVPPSLGVVTARLKVRASAEGGVIVPSGPWGGGCAGGALKEQGAGVQKPRGVRGKRFRPLLRHPEVAGPGASLGLGASGPAAARMWRLWLGLPELV